MHRLICGLPASSVPTPPPPMRLVSAPTPPPPRACLVSAPNPPRAPHSQPPPPPRVPRQRAKPPPRPSFATPPPRAPRSRQNPPPVRLVSAKPPPPPPCASLAPTPPPCASLASTPPPARLVKRGAQSRPNYGKNWNGKIWCRDKTPRLWHKRSRDREWWLSFPLGLWLVTVISYCFWMVALIS